jgi:hypothetical protein
MANEESPVPTVTVVWDPIEGNDSFDTFTESDEILLPNKWNKTVEGAWRLDLDLEAEHVS